jgi:phospholipase C
MVSVRIRSALLLVLLLCSVSAEKARVVKQPTGKIKHIILLCMENHSYDAVLGFMESPIGDLTGYEHNYVNPQDLSSQPYFVNKGQKFITTPDPPHSFSAVNQQLFGSKDYPVNSTSTTPDMSGFAWVYQQRTGKNPQNVMDMFDPTQIPVMATLARNFRVHKRWFASYPGCTCPNKWFLYCAQSHGRTANPGSNPFKWKEEQFPLHMRSIFQNLEEEGYDWAIHFNDWNEAIFVYPTNTLVNSYKIDPEFKGLYAKMKNGTLPAFTYVVPAAIPNPINLNPPNSQHPPEDYRWGEQLIKNMYENLRNSPSWDDTLLIITYDEHGGFYDSVPSTHPLPNPYPESAGYPDTFAFDRPGVRVPGLTISRWLPNKVDMTFFEHSTIPATVKSLLNMQSPFLTARDAQSALLVSESDLLDVPRTDCPETLP